MKRAHGPVEGDISLAKQNKVTKDPRLDYSLCVICQQFKNQTKLNKIQKDSARKLKLAMSARNDNIADKLKDDVENDLWVEEKIPKWHRKCRSWYINEKNYSLVQKKTR